MTHNTLQYSRIIFFIRHVHIQKTPAPLSKMSKQPNHSLHFPLRLMCLEDWLPYHLVAGNLERAELFSY